MIWPRKKEMGKEKISVAREYRYDIQCKPSICIFFINFGCIVKCKANDIKTRDRSVWYYKRPSNPQSVRDVRTIVWLLFNMYKVKFCWKSHWKTGHSDIPLLRRCYPGEIHKELKSDFPLVQVDQMSVMEFFSSKNREPSKLWGRGWGKDSGNTLLISVLPHLVS